MTIASPTLCATALSYAARGWHVVPLHDVTQGHCSCAKGSACETPGKHPRLQDWPTAATIHAATIQDWWHKWPGANVGIVPGQRSGCAIIDVDPRNGGDISLDELQHTYSPLPETSMVLSGGGGLHYYFQVSEDLPSIDLAPGINFLADGSHQAVAPPSLHPSGQHYVWEASSHPDDLPLAPLPDWIMALVQSQVHEREVAAATLPKTLPEVPVETLRISPRMKQVIQQGNDADRPYYASRSEAPAAVYTAMVAAGYDDVTIAALVLSPAYGISAKPLSQKNPRSPLYWTLTRGWVALDIARVRAKYAGQPDHQRQQHGPVPGPEPPDPYACPELPESARTDEHRAAEASLFLDDYIAFSQKWAPRAYDGFHEAIALFVLATTAARRVRIALGSGTYTSLYIALAARTSLFTKSTAADIGLALLRRAGLDYLLADDDATPQALLRAIAGCVDVNYAHLDDLAQIGEQRRLAFRAQRGWFYEEWGQHLEAMMDTRGIMAGFRSILRRLDDHHERYVYSTISRGREVLAKPYLSLLANVTPADLQPFVKKDSKLWRDGFIARFAFVTPGEDAVNDTAFPRGERIIPAKLVADLHTWHARLGIPACRIEPEYDAKGKPKDTYHAVYEPLPETTYTLHDDVWHSYYAYDQALRMLTAQRKAEYLDGSYVRFPQKALRIAALLASLHDDAGQHIIWPTHWARAQAITERWRRDLHRLAKQVHTQSQEPSPKRQLEESLLRQVRRHGPQSLADFVRHHKTRGMQDICAEVETLVNAGLLVRVAGARGEKFALAPES